MLTRYEEQIERIRTQILDILVVITDASEETLDAFQNSEEARYSSVIESLKNVQSDANEIDNEVIKVFALFGPEANELRQLVAYLKMTNELVRIAEGVKKYARRMKEHKESGCDLSSIKGTVAHLHKSTLTALQLIRDCFKNLERCDVDDFYRQIVIEENKNDDLFEILETEIIEYITAHASDTGKYIKVLGTLRKLERSCDRSVNIANLMLYVKNGGELKIYN